MMPASEGVHGKVDVVRDTDTDKGEGVKKSKNLAGIMHFWKLPDEQLVKQSRRDEIGSQHGLQHPLASRRPLSTNFGLLCE